VSRVDQLDELFRQNRISYPEYKRAQGLLGLHSIVHVRLQSPDTVYGPAALPVGMIRSVKSGIAGVLEHVMVQSHQLTTGDLEGATRERVAHSATVLADSTYSPVNLDPMEVLAKAERFLRDPGTDPLDAYQLMVDPTYVPDDRTPDFFLHSNSEALKDFAREVSPEATERAERAVIIYDLGADVALSVAIPELLAAKGAGFIDDAALIGRLDDVLLLERQAARRTMSMPRYMDGGGTLGSWMSKYPQAPHNSVFRGDSALRSATNAKGIGKSHVSSTGDLVPANLAGLHNGRPVTVAEHVLGGFRRGAKSNSPFTSFTPQRATAAGYGSEVVSVDIAVLRKAIRSGEVTGVAVLNQRQIQRLIGQNPHLSDFWKGRASRWSSRDQEFLIRGTIPERFFSVD
jgi:hypothetical protein